MSKETTFTIRVDSDLKDQFVASCKSNDTTASQVFRGLMRDYVARHGQTDLFSGGGKKKAPK